MVPVLISVYIIYAYIYMIYIYMICIYDMYIIYRYTYTQYFIPILGTFHIDENRGIGPLVYSSSPGWTRWNGCAARNHRGVWVVSHDKSIASWQYLVIKPTFFRKLPMRFRYLSECWKSFPICKQLKNISKWGILISNDFLHRIFVASPPRIFCLKPRLLPCRRCWMLAS